MSDIVARLRNRERLCLEGVRPLVRACEEAATEIERLREQVQQLGQAASVSIDWGADEIERHRALQEEMVAVLNGARIVIKNRDQNENEARVLAAIMSVLSRAES